MSMILLSSTICLILVYFADVTICQDVLGCGGFVKSEVEINFSVVEVKLYTKQGTLKYQTDCAPNNGYYMIPLYDKGDYVLKVEPPPGWTFEPQSVELHVDGKTDKCSLGEDINFQFTGFGIVGKVVSRGIQSGPAGVTLTLKKAGSTEPLKQVVSAKGGSYTFEKVLPGDYVIEGSHPKWIFDSSSAEVKVGKETGNAGELISIVGYDVHGKVFSEGDPIKGVNFLVFSDEITAEEVANCDKSRVKGFEAVKGVTSPLLCHTASKEDGTFEFPSLPVGTYMLIPFYKGEHIKFDVVPDQLEFSVFHDTVLLEQPFQVAGFSVSGMVLHSKKGKGVPGAKIYLNGKEQTTSGPDGSYHLENMKAGTYTLQVLAENIFFDDVKTKITPNTPQLPDIVAVQFSLCGRVLIDKIPEGLSQLTRERHVTIQGKGQMTHRTLVTDAQGNFCTKAKPGEYILRAVVTSEEQRAGLKLSPAETSVTVTFDPVSEITFSQFRAKVKGQITCLENCGLIQVSLSPIGRADEKQVVQAASRGKNAPFEFTNILPGRYRVLLLHEDWCWQEKSREVDVVDQDISDIAFVQSGFILSCSLSHDVTLKYQQEGSTSNKGSFNLSKGVHKLCLTSPGTYSLTPESCHQFEQPVYRYDTSNPSVLSLTAVRHLAEASIVMAERVQDITVTIKTSIEGQAPLTLGPLKSDKEPVAPKSPKEKAVEPEGPFTYRFTYWARGGEKLHLTPQSGEFLFSPSSTDVTVLGDKCPGQVATFKGNRGVFIEGRIEPALPGVKVTITSTSDLTSSIHVETNVQGGYRVGPLSGNSEYKVNAEKEGYVMSEVKGQPGHFKAFKLGEISVQVIDQEHSGLQGVLLSLSGGTNYRSNNLTQYNGSLVFTTLSPGQYFLRPMMKEYKFDPPSQMIDVLEGSTVNLKIRGQRVAFSCYGAVTSLNGDPEPGVFVEAQGRDSCAHFQEESKTEQDGGFRIRGLQPNCEYDVQLKTGEVNQHIERSAPKIRQVKVTNQDLTQVNIIAFRRMNQLDLSGNVITPQEFLPSLKVHLYREENMDNAVHTVNLGLTQFFYLPSLTIDFQTYVVRLGSTLSRSAYEYVLPEITFTANTSYKHFTFKFDPKSKESDQELSPSSVLVLPLTLLIILAGYHHQKILPFLLQGAGYLQNYISKQNMATHQPVAPAASIVENIDPDIAQEISQPKKKPKARKV